MLKWNAFGYYCRAVTEPLQVLNDWGLGKMRSKYLPEIPISQTQCFHLIYLLNFLSLFSLPKVVKRRVNALKNLQVKCAHIEAKFYEEVHELERKYAALYQPLFDKVRTRPFLSTSYSQYVLLNLSLVRLTAVCLWIHPVGEFNTLRFSGWTAAAPEMETV